MTNEAKSKRRTIDILYRSEGGGRSRKLLEETVKDIALDEVIGYMTSDEEEGKILREILINVPEDPEDMIYRQEILKDLTSDETLCSRLKDVLSSIKILDFFGNGARKMHDRDGSLASLLEQLRELKVYVEAVSKIQEALSSSNICSPGLTALRELLEEITGTEEFKSIKPDIEKIHSDLQNARGAIIGVTLTADMEIENVTAVEFVDYKPRSSYTIMDVAVGSKVRNPFNDYKYQDPLLVSITPFMKKHLRKHIGEVKQLILKHSGYDARFLTDIYKGLVFYLNAADLERKLRSSGCPTSFPEILETPGQEIRGLYNIRLVIKGQKDIVKNDFDFSDREKIFILTGPNRGGKTILEQSLALVSVMASQGMFVTCDHFRGAPFKNILTHFPIDENLTINYGRLGEEAVRIRQIVKEAGPDTLILFNETFSTTSAADALYLAKDLIRILKERGSSVIFNTHIHELARAIPEMNGWEGQSDVVSIVMEILDNKNTFKVRRSDPDTSSYARKIAEKYGITYEQMKELDAAPG